MNAYCSDCRGNVIQMVMETPGSDNVTRNNILMDYDNVLGS